VKFASLSFLPLLSAADFQLREHRLAPGTRADIQLPVPFGSDPATHIPVSVFHGAKEGPTLLLSVGIHGAEYVPILATQQLLKRLDPKRMAGTLIVVPVAHVASFERATVYYNPFDHKNLARVFPGRPAGTQTERIAHIFTTELLRRADVLIDLHGGDATESLHPFGGV
jgi:predicted deacylase